MQTELNDYDARRITNLIKAGRPDAIALIAEAYNRRADAALQYQSWDRYCHAELGDVSLFSNRDERQQAVRCLHDAGLRNRPISYALGMDEKTVRGDLKADGPQPGEAPACDGRPIVIPGTVKTSPLHYARLAQSMLAEIDGEQYGPDDLTAEQLRLLGVLRDALAQFSTGWDREEKESIQRSEGES